jgi:hypothetical protein
LGLSIYILADLPPDIGRIGDLAYRDIVKGSVVKHLSQLPVKFVI